MSTQPRATGRHLALLTSLLLQCEKDTERYQPASPKGPAAGSETRPDDTGTLQLLNTKTKAPRGV